MKTAWTMKKNYSARTLTFGECLRRAWAKAKAAIANAAYAAVEFVNNMNITIDGYTRTLTRWTKGDHDRVYINGGSRAGDGWVDLNNRTSHLRGELSYQVKIADAILSMTF